MFVSSLIRTSPPAMTTSWSQSGRETAYLEKSLAFSQRALQDGHMRSAVFLSQQWPMRHEHLVEECVAAGGVLHVNDVLPLLTAGIGQLVNAGGPATQLPSWHR